MSSIPEYVDGLPNLSGSEELVERVIAEAADRHVFLDDSRVPFERIRSACAIALHMHQPLTPTGGDDLHTAALIGNLQTMAEHPDVGDNHNAPAFRRCYARMGEFIPTLLAEGLEPRVMLEYSGTLLHGLRIMGADDVIDGLKRITCATDCRRAVEWLGSPWGHAVAPSTPVQDFRLHVRAWQHHFAAIFGLGSARAGARLLAVRDGAAEPSGGGVRIRAHAPRMRLSMGAGAGAHGRGTRDGRTAAPTAPAASAGLPQLPRATRPASSRS